MGFKILKKDRSSRARLGVLETPHGAVETPAYAVVGTRAKVRELSAEDLIKTKTQIVIANTYHLWRSLGDDGLKSYPSLHKVMDWNRPLITDSGGFQVFSMGFARELGGGKVASLPGRSGEGRNRNLTRITPEGVYFEESGEECFLDAEKSIWIQEHLGADVILAFDEPTSPRHDYAYTKKSLERTHDWAARSLRAKKSSQLIYGIVQGGGFENLRKESAEFIGAMDFDGFAVGGSFGVSFGGHSKTFQELDWTVPLLPEAKPRHLLGIGLVEDIFACVARGMDTFDCVVPTREGRHGNLYTSAGEVDITRGSYRGDQSVLDPDCACFVCAVKKVSKAELHALFKSKNPQAGHLASFHNVCFFNNLMVKIRESIREGTFGELKSSFERR